MIRGLSLSESVSDCFNVSAEDGEVLEIRNLGKKYDDVHALKSLSFKLEPGHCTVLMGPNGAGKSTAIKILTGLIRADHGEFLWNGSDLFPRPEKIRELLAYVSQESALDKVLTGREFMKFHAGLVHLPWKQISDRAGKLLEQIGLGEAAERRIGKYSGGMKRRLDLACALLQSPKILVLDEPTNGLDIEARELIWRMVSQFKSEGGSVILVSHDFREVRQLGDQVVILNHGEAVRQGRAETLTGELGNFVIRIRTREFHEAKDSQTIAKALASQDFQQQEDPDQACFVYTGTENLDGLHNLVSGQVKQAGLPLFSLNIQKPQLEDVYRFATGGHA